MPTAVLTSATLAAAAVACLLWGSDVLGNGRIAKVASLFLLLVSAGSWRLRRRHVIALVARGEKVVWRSPIGRYEESSTMVQELVDLADRHRLLIPNSSNASTNL